MENSKKSAFPLTNDGGIGADIDIQYGLTKREYFAGLAMQAIISATPEVSDYPKAEDVAEKAVTYANELLKQLS